MMKQPANMKECISNAFQLLLGRCILNEMRCVTCDWCADACELGEVASFLSKFFTLGAVLPSLP